MAVATPDQITAAEADYQTAQAAFATADAALTADHTALAAALKAAQQQIAADQMTRNLALAVFREKYQVLLTLVRQT